MTRAGPVRFARRWWWLVAALAVVVPAVAFMVMDRADEPFVSTATYVLQPDADDGSDVVRGAAALSNASEINSTYAEIVESDLIRSRSLARLGLGNESIDDLDLGVKASPVGRTNILEVAVSSHDPALAHDFAAAVGAETSDYVTEVSDVFVLSELDAPTLPVDRARTNYPERVAAWLVLGGLLGVGVAMLLDRRVPESGSRGSRPAGGSATSIRNEHYSLLRLREEMSRSDHLGTPLRLAVLRFAFPWRADRGGVNVATPGRHEVGRAGRKVARRLRPHDHVGHIASLAPGTFVALLPDATDERLDDLLSVWSESTAKRMARRHGPGVIVSAASCDYVDGAFRGDQRAVVVADALDEASRT